MKKTILTLASIVLLLTSCEKEENINYYNTCNHQTKIEKYYHYKTKYIYSDNSIKEYLFDSTSTEQFNYFYFDGKNPISFDIIFVPNPIFQTMYNVTYSDSIFYPKGNCKTTIWSNEDRNQLYIVAKNPGNNNYPEQKKIIFLKKCKNN